MLNILSMKKLYALAFALTLLQVKAQVGINTPNPLANLEVHRSNLATIPDGIIPPRISADSLQLKDHLYGPAQNGAMIYVTDIARKTSSKTQRMTSSGYYVYDASYLNKDNSAGIWKKMFSDPNAFAVSSSGKTSFSKVALKSSKSSFHRILFDSAIDSQVGAEYMVDNQYLVPETGLYVINFSISFNDPKSQNFTERPDLTIIKTTNNHETQSFLAQKMLYGMIPKDGKGNFSVSTSSGINHIYNLQQGDQLGFGLLGEGFSSADLKNTSIEISIYKIR